MALMPEQLADFVEATLNKYQKTEYTDFTLDRYKVAPELFGMGKKPNWDSGPHYEFKVRVATDGNARVTGLYDTDRSNVNNQLDKGTVDWSMYTTNFIYDVQEESFQSDNAQKIIDVIRVREHGMYEDMWERWEADLWTAPASEDQKPRPLAGLPTWIVKASSFADADAEKFSFGGGNPSGWSSGIGRINSNTYSQWKNGTFKHDGTVTRDGFIKRVVKATVFCKFEAAHAYPASVAPNKQDRYGFYTTYPMWEGLADFCRSQNDNLGKDGAAMYDGSPTIRGNKVREVPYLTTNDSGTAAGNDPFYGVNWQSIGFARRRGWWLKRHKPQQVAGSHNVYRVNLDSHVAVVCTDRRQNFVGHR